MMHMKHKIRTALVPPSFADAEKTRKAKLLNNLILVLLAVMIVGTPVIILTAPQNPGLFILLYFSVMGLLLLSFGFLRARSLITSAWLLLFCLWVTDVGLSIAAGKISGSVIYTFVALIMIATLILNEWAAFFMAVVSLSTCLGLYALDIQDTLPHLIFQNPQIANLVFLSYNVLAVLLVLILAVRDIRITVTQLRKNEQTLEERNQELQMVRDNLEHQIAERTFSADLSRSEAETANRTLQAEVWRIAGLAELANAMRGIQEIPDLAHNVIQMLCQYLDAQVGAVYIKENTKLRLIASYAFSHRRRSQNTTQMGQGLVGQAALEKQVITLTRVPDGYMDIVSGLGHAAPREIIAAPILYENHGIGVVEIGTIAPFTPAQLAFIDTALENIGVAFNTAQTRARIDELLLETKQQAEELQVREEELKSANLELARQTEILRSSENRLRDNQVQLQIANTELQNKAAALEKSSKILLEQKSMLDRRNQELELVQEELQLRAEELAQASQYKSEFLANISHELRTPLNSMLILARMLADNDAGNLTKEQVESANVIHNSGRDLLGLINEILDLSKVEAGRVEFQFQPVNIQGLMDSVRMQFKPVADEKNLAFEITVVDDVPAFIETDEVRVNQILKNLLSNALKFTDEGYVHLRVYQQKQESGNMLAFEVSDTGIGMTPEQESIVFEAFRQADGSTSRRYGGTGLGLAISLQLAQHLGGNITLESEYGQGSTFTLTLPSNIEPVEILQQTQDTNTLTAGTTRTKQTSTLPPLPKPVAISNEAEEIVEQAGNDHLLLIVEDDPSFGKVLSGFAKDKGFRSLIASDGETGIQLAKKYNPVAILLDLNLPGISGWDVLDNVKRDPTLRHIPVHIISAQDKTLDAFLRGAVGFLTKPAEREELNGVFEKIENFISKTIKTVLLVEDNQAARYSIRQLLDGSDVNISEADSGIDALHMLQTQNFDCMILDLDLPDMTGFKVLNRLETLNNINKCPVIVYTGQALTEDENYELMKYADSVIIKGVKSPDRLLDETALFLHRVVTDTPDEDITPASHLHDQETVLSGKNILIVDDDMRGAFALSKLLGDKDLAVSIAHSGVQGLEILETNSDIDLILMDIMMPEMNGYETIKRIRAQKKYENIPILAVTAKAMKGDAEKCIDAGASDYLSKPIDVDRLFSMLRVWLYQ
jgi:CheY-like chemotaxis protein/signal transduction histidine kinase